MKMNKLPKLSRPRALLAEMLADKMMLIHLSSLIGLVVPAVGFVLGPLVMWLLFRKAGWEIDRTGREVLNFQLSMLVGTIAAGIFSVILLGIPFLIMFYLMQILLPVVAALKLRKGERFEYPMSYPFVK
ncbi:DUF4870 domain-containing protein [Pontibacter sp. G13]|uniref:DUF4870 domain-containing protein n=1 Tax=Pontibacter sp. G13 TaxID=3074898 RepID=UPI00288B7F5E|nr:DUF4870 domain-containing protein [Pontibacter sp. G13]WNJ20417.1 DUF4870 domain-containing protein [Pontibacter sp. G13]